MIAMQRCYENDVHDSVHTNTGENYAVGTYVSAAQVHQGWHDSQGHHDNYMKTKYDRGAVAVFRTNGAAVAYEVFFINGQVYTTSLALPETDEFQVTTGFAPAYYARPTRTWQQPSERT